MTFTNFSPGFKRLRTTAFCIIMFLAFLDVSLLCVYISLNWDNVDTPTHSLLSVMTAVDAATPIVLLILLIRDFRPWLDMARVAGLLGMMQFGIAATFAYWYPQLKCSTSQSPDSQGLCGLANYLILLGSWIIPAFIVAYAGGLGYAMWRVSNQAPEMAQSNSILPILRPGYHSHESSTSSRGSEEARRKHISSITTTTRSSLQKTSPIIERDILPVLRPGYISGTASERSSRGSAEAQRKHISSIPTTSSNLSKPPPAFFV
uniref:Uncharacterized protein n=1 Tax=Mycena chlorophos TaxID=658473 RepID=A0ABQ0L7S2_MYCCL|nr:predicted protein [Mycena chlorophos]